MNTGVDFAEKHGVALSNPTPKCLSIGQLKGQDGRLIFNLNEQSDTHEASLFLCFL